MHCNTDFLRMAKSLCRNDGSTWHFQNYITQQNPLKAQSNQSQHDAPNGYPIIILLAIFARLHCIFIPQITWRFSDYSVYFKLVHFNVILSLQHFNVIFYKFTTFLYFTSLENPNSKSLNCRTCYYCFSPPEKVHLSSWILHFSPVRIVVQNIGILVRTLADLPEAYPIGWHISEGPDVL